MTDFPRTTETAHRAMDYAQREARRLDHRVVEPEHLLLGLAREDVGKVARILRACGVDARQLRLRIERTLKPGEPLDTFDFEWSLRTRRILRSAEEEASGLGQYGVEAEHLLLALLSEGQSAPCEILNEMGVTYEKVHAKLDRQLRAQRVADKISDAYYNFLDFLGEPFRLAAKRKPPIEVSPVFVGIVLATAVFGGLMYFRVLPRLSIFFFVACGWIVSLCLHEFGHALIAYIGGDFDVYVKGYLSFNPIRYTHPVLSIILPLVFLLLGGIGLPGGAVYINRAAIHDRRIHSLVSAAGPIGTFLCAVVLMIPFVTGLAYLNTSAHLEFWAGLALLALLEITGVVLNLIPFPGLDGFGIIAPFLPERFVARVSGLYQFTYLFLFVLFISPLGVVFWAVIWFVCSLVNLDHGLALTGLNLFRFWS